jgi:hypothetical protein
MTGAGRARVPEENPINNSKVIVMDCIEGVLWFIWVTSGGVYANV